MAVPSSVATVLDISFLVSLVPFWGNLGIDFGFPTPACWSVKAPRDALQLP